MIERAAAPWHQRISLRTRMLIISSLAVASPSPSDSSMPLIRSLSCAFI